MSRPTTICLSCKTEIKLTESLAAPLLESTRREYEKRLAKRDADVAKREAGLREREEAIAKAKEQLDEQVAETVRLERGKIAAEEAKKAKLAMQTDLDQKTQALADLQQVIEQQNTKLAEAQKAQTDMQEELDKKKKAITKRWAKREEQIELVMGSTMGSLGTCKALRGSRCRRLRG